MDNLCGKCRRWGRGGFQLSESKMGLRFKGASFDDNSGSGSAWTLAAFWQPGASRRWRVGAEWLDVDAERPEALRSGASPRVGGEQVQLGIRFAL